MNDFNNFLERATALRDAIKKDTNDVLKDVRLDILSQLVGQVFLSGKIPDNFKIQSYCVNAARLTSEILKELQIEVEITFNKTVHLAYYQITEVNAHVDNVDA